MCWREVTNSDQTARIDAPLGRSDGTPFDEEAVRAPEPRDLKTVEVETSDGTGCKRNLHHVTSIACDAGP